MAELGEVARVEEAARTARIDVPRWVEGRPGSPWI
jgi:hypothetical protein